MAEAPCHLRPMATTASWRASARSARHRDHGAVLEGAQRDGDIGTDIVVPLDDGR
ncbi:hypothetical protein [Rubrivirga sp.]|uniref:hypothetical protein n=1 Tax=Rubrivirga sp. TaxID=1885344 RepID=UPI003C71D544